MLAASHPKATVLVVEDDAIARELLAHVLQTGGFEVITRSTGEQALLVLCHQGAEIDWLVSKVSLPGLVCGWILKDEYNEHHPDRPVLLISPLAPADAPAVHAVFVPPGAPMRILDLLQALKNPEQAQVLQFPAIQAA